MYSTYIQYVQYIQISGCKILNQPVLIPDQFPLIAALLTILR